jgi:hypothetical protein
MSRRRLPALAAAALTFAFLATATAAETTVTCESHDDRRVHCPADTRGGVRLQTQLSRSPCDYGDTWGYDRRGVWVDGGCRATFAVDEPRYDDEGYGDGYDDGYDDDRFGYGSPGGVILLRCESHDGRNVHCPADTRGGVRLEHRLSRAACVYGESWGYDRHGIWVDDGCRAEFSVADGGDGWGGGPGDGPAGGYVVECSSRDGRRAYCRADTHRGVRLDEQLSRSRCVEGRTWGWDPGGIWVDDGCRGRFLVGRYGGRGDHGRGDDYGDDRHDDDDDTAAIVGGALILGAVAAAVVAETEDQRRDRRAEELCRAAVEDRLYRRGGDEVAVFDEATVDKEQRPIRVVTGGVRLERDGATLQTLRVRCRVNMETDEVEDVSLGEP